jgi:hypothetical protein
MLWIIAAILLLAIIALTTSLVRNARRLRRDFNHKVTAFRVRLDEDANSVVDTLLKRNTLDDSRRGS